MSLGSCSAVAAAIMSPLASSAIRPPLMTQIVGRNVTGPRYRVRRSTVASSIVDAAALALDRGDRIAEPVDDRDGSFAGDEPERAGLGDLGVRWLASLDGGGRHDLLAGKRTRAQPNCSGGDGPDRASFGELLDTHLDTFLGPRRRRALRLPPRPTAAGRSSAVNELTVRSRSARTIDSASPIDEMISASAGHRARQSHACRQRTGRGLRPRRRPRGSPDSRSFCVVTSRYTSSHTASLAAASICSATSTPSVLQCSPAMSQRREAGLVRCR